METFYGATLKYIKKFKCATTGAPGCFIGTSSRVAGYWVRWTLGVGFLVDRDRSWPLIATGTREGPVVASIMFQFVHDMASLNTHYHSQEEDRQKQKTHR